jgi:hypothetical protein
MTRRGSLVYYLSAWILGCFFISFGVWLRDIAFKIPTALGNVSALLLYYFYGLVLGALPALILGFLLRRFAAMWKCKTPWHWAIFGALLNPLLVGMLGILGESFNTATLTGWWVLEGLTLGPHLVLETGLWLAIPAGAATGYFLCRIERAFAPQPQPPASTNV